jgi:hypothetical protein
MFGYVRGQGTPYFFIFIVMGKPIYTQGDYVLIMPSDKDWGADFYIQSIIGNNGKYKYICSLDKEGLECVRTYDEDEIQYRH